jgi:MFS family permease
LEKVSFLITNFIFHFIHWMVLAYLPFLFKSYGLTNSMIGTVISLYAISSMVLVLPMGFLSDYFSPKRIIIVGAFLFDLYFLFLLLVKSFPKLIPVALVGGIASAILTTVLYALYLKIIGKDRKGREVALFQLGSYLGYGFGPLAGGVLLSKTQPSTLFTIALILSFALLFTTFFLKDSTPIIFSFKEYHEDFKRLRTLILISGIFVMATHFGVEQSSLTLLMSENVKLSPSKIGMIFCGIGLWMACLVPFAGYLRDLRGKVFTFLWFGLLISGAFQFITGFVSSSASLLLVRILHTTGDTMAILEIGVLTALFFPEHRLGGNSGLLLIIRTLAIFVGAFVAGFLNMKFGYGASFMANGAFVFIFALTILILRLKIPMFTVSC